MSRHVAATLAQTLCGSTTEVFGSSSFPMAEWQRLIFVAGEAPCIRCARHVLRYPSLAQMLNRGDRERLIHYLRFRGDPE